MSDAYNSNRLAELHELASATGYCACGAYLYSRRDKKCTACTANTPAGPYYVYFLRSGSLIKIGVTRVDQFERRVAGLKSQNAAPLELIGKVYTEDRKLEKQYHARWAKQRQHGEYFIITPELAAWISRIIGKPCYA